MSIRVVLADDHPIFREGLVRSIAEDPGFVVVGEAGTADEAIALVETERPDVALLDVSMPGGGIAAAAAIATRFPGTRIAMLTVSENDHDVLAAMKAGAIGYVLKGVSASGLRDILREVAAGKPHVSPSLAAAGAGGDAGRRRTPRPAAHRRPHQARGGHPAPRGARPQQQGGGEALGLQEKTVKHYMTTILEKLQARNRVEAALIARDAWGA